MATLMYARERAAWIVNHAGRLGFQTRRGQLLQGADDDRKRAISGVDYNRHLQAVTERFWLRAVQSRAGAAELVVVVGAALIFPLAWPLGRLLYLWLVGRVAAARQAGTAHGLWSIPITALGWISAALMFVAAVLIDPSGSTLLGVIVPPWIAVQGAGIFVMASVYGVMEGWLAIPGATGWWPFPPPPLPPAGSLAAEYDSATGGAPPPPGHNRPTPFRVPRPGKPDGRP